MKLSEDKEKNVKVICPNPQIYKDTTYKTMSVFTTYTGVKFNKTTKPDLTCQD